MEHGDHRPFDDDAIAVWPLLGLELHTERLVLRPVEQTSGLALGALAARGIHDPATMPFVIPFTDAEPGPLRRSAFQFYARSIAEWSAAAWHLVFVTSLADTGEVIGCQGLHANDFPRLRLVDTGSWLGLAHQGKGYGKEQRAAVVSFAFAGLGAERADTGAWHDNETSINVTRSLGYEPDGTARALRRDRPDAQVRFTLSRTRWEQVHHDWPGAPVEIRGLDAACLELFGLGPDGEALATPPAST